MIATGLQGNEIPFLIEARLCILTLSRLCVFIMASFTKWLSVRLQTNWLWIQISFSHIEARLFF